MTGKTGRLAPVLPDLAHVLSASGKRTAKFKAMSYILISAEFPEVTPEHYNHIASELEQRYWRKSNEQEISINTTWLRFFPNDISEETAKNTAIRNFKEACNLYCGPRLVIHFGANRPQFHGYMVTSLSL